MKIVVISCNYFANDGRLKATLDSLRKNKESVGCVKICIADNASTDGSADTIKEYYENGTIDLFKLNDRNLGKCKAMNALFDAAKEKFGIEQDDLILHLDSDIELSDNFMKNLLDDYEKLSEEFGQDGINAVFPRFGDDFPNATLFDVNECNDTKSIDGKWTRRPGIAGGCMVVPAKKHIGLNGYNEEIQGKNGYPIYSGDDADFILRLGIKYKNGVNVICNNLKAFVKEETDKGYSDYKIKLLSKVRGRIPTNSECGYYDKGGSENPTVHVIIPSPGMNDMLEKCLDSIVRNTSTDNINLKIHTICTKKDDNSMQGLGGRYPNLTNYNSWFYHFSEINNKAVFEWFKDEIKDDDFLVFCNNDIEFKSDCINEMLKLCCNDWAGTVGSLLFFEDGTIQHAGIFVDQKQHQVGHILYKQNPNSIDENQLHGNRAVYGNTAALMMIKYKDFASVGGFDEEFDICFEDVDLNLKLIMAGKKNIVCGKSVALHKESSTRGKELSKLDILRIRMKIAEFFYAMELAHNGGK